MDHSTQMLLFDLGGVLVELAGTERMLHFAGNSMTESRLWEMWLNSSVVRDFETGRIEPRKFAEALIVEFSLSAEPEEILAELAEWVPGPVTGAAQFLEELSADFKLGILSNTNAIHWERIDAKMGITQYFDFIFVSCQTGLMKPDRRAYELVIEETGYPPGSIVYFDDLERNTSAALETGIRAFCVKSIEDIKRILLSLSGFPA